MTQRPSGQAPASQPPPDSSPSLAVSRPAHAEALLAIAPLRAIVRLAAPTTLVMLISAATSVLLTYFVSRLGAEAIAAMSLVFPVTLLATTAMAGGIGAGAGSAVARSLGARQRREAARVAEHGLLLAAGLGVLFGGSMIAWAPGLLRLMGGTGEVLELASRFARVLLGGSAITFIGAMLDSLLRGEGNVRVPTLWSSVSLGLQIVLTPLLMFVFDLGLLGAALSILTAQLIAIVPRTAHMLGRQGLLRGAVWPPRLSLEPLAEILRVGIPASLSTVVANVGGMVLTGVLARLGTAHLAAYGLGTRLDFLFLSIAYGTGAAILTLVGLATGARRADLVRGYLGRAALLVFTVLAVPSTVLCLRPRLWFGLFTQDEAILEVGTAYLRILGPSYPFVGVTMLLAFAFQGLGRATAPLVLMVVRTTAVMALAIVCTSWLGLADRAVFTAVAAANILSCTLLGALYLRMDRLATGAARSRVP